jgi:hypothetical protein
MNIRKKVAWSFLGKKKIAPFRASMQSYSTVLTLIMQTLNKLVWPSSICLLLLFANIIAISEAMQVLESHITKEAKEITLQLQKGAQDVKQEISKVIDGPWDQKPIQFQDAIGRKYPIPLEVCATYDVRP